jgi:hypothetical protein
MRATSRPRVLLSEGSSLTAREILGVLGPAGVGVEVLSPEAWPLARFSRWCRAVHRSPIPSSDPAGYLRAVDALMRTGRFAALLPSHEQAWLFAAGRHLLPHANPPVADIAAFDCVQSKVAFARTLDGLGLPQPAWRTVSTLDDISALGFPVWLKSAYSTAGRGVIHVHDKAESEAAWIRLHRHGDLMIQAEAPGRYAQVQGVFDHGRLIGSAASELLTSGVGGSAAARISVSHPEAFDAIRTLGTALAWHGGLTLDYLHVGGHPLFIECNPRMIEPGNAAAAGVSLPALLMALADGGRLPRRPLIARPGIRTRSTMAIALGAAERAGTRRAVLCAVANAVARRPPLNQSFEVLTPLLRDPAGIIPVGAVMGGLLADPRRVGRFAGRSVAEYSVTPGAIMQVRLPPGC